MEMTSTTVETSVTANNSPIRSTLTQMIVVLTNLKLIQHCIQQFLKANETGGSYQIELEGAKRECVYIQSACMAIKVLSLINIVALPNGSRSAKWTAYTSSMFGT